MNNPYAGGVIAQISDGPGGKCYLHGSVGSTGIEYYWTPRRKDATRFYDRESAERAVARLTPKGTVRYISVKS